MPTPPSSTSSNSGQSPGTQFRVVRKRNRVPLSCAPCRHRKLKCNRGHPCDNCSKRGDSDSCTYAAPGTRKKNPSSHGSASSPDDMQNRIDRLEGLVLSLMTNGAQSAGPTAATALLASSSEMGSSAEAPLDVDSHQMIKEEQEGADDSEIEGVAKSLGIMKVMDGNKAVYASESHWYAILGEIAEVKNYFAEHKKQYDEQLRKVRALNANEESPGTAFLFRSHKPATREEIMQSFPSKSTADMLITRYFNTYDPAVHIIHGPTFQKQYDQHWMAPNETPIIWIGMVFAMMCLALQSYSRTGDEPPEFRGRSWDMSNDYRRQVAQCLTLADIIQPIAQMLETLILYVQAEFARSKDAETGVLITVSILVRLAMRMGYHRDPEPFQGITPFQGEMRRRVWTVIRQLDLLFSSQAGLPPIVRATDTNTALPRNIYDDELYEEMKALPVSRPITEETPASYMIAKAHLVYMYGRIVEASQALTSTTYEEIMKLDHRLREVQATMPPHLHMRPLEDSTRDPSNIIMQRYSLDLLYLRSQCVLHRKFLGASRESSRYAYSRRTCIDASMTILRHQATLHNESRPGGRLRAVRWFISSLTTSDFLLAAMIVCLDLYHTAEAERHNRRSSNDILEWPREHSDSMMAALEGSLKIWEGLRDQSMEAYKAHGTISVMIDKIKRHRAMRQAQQSFAAAAAAYPASANTDDANVAPEHSAAMTLGMLSTGALTPNAAGLFDSRQYPSYESAATQLPPTGLTSNYSGPGELQNGPVSAPSPFFSLFASNLGFQTLDAPSTDIDWDAWDSYIQGTTLDPTNQVWPMNMDLQMPLVDPQADGFASQPPPQLSQPPVNSNLFAANGGGPFMGVGTPPRHC